MKYFDIRWVSTLLFITGGTTVALKLPFLKYAFPAFVIAHAILVHYFLRVHPNKPLLFQNIYFFFLNAIASYVWIFA